MILRSSQMSNDEGQLSVENSPNYESRAKYYDTYERLGTDCCLWAQEIVIDLE